MYPGNTFLRTTYNGPDILFKLVTYSKKKLRQWLLKWAFWKHEKVNIHRLVSEPLPHDSCIAEGFQTHCGQSPH